MRIFHCSYFLAPLYTYRHGTKARSWWTVGSLAHIYLYTSCTSWIMKIRSTAFAASSYSFSPFPRSNRDWCSHNFKRAHDEQIGMCKPAYCKCTYAILAATQIGKPLTTALPSPVEALAFGFVLNVPCDFTHKRYLTFATVETSKFF